MFDSFRFLIRCVYIIFNLFFGFFRLLKVDIIASEEVYFFGFWSYSSSVFSPRISMANVMSFSVICCME